MILKSDRLEMRLCKDIKSELLHKKNQTRKTEC